MEWSQVKAMCSTAVNLVKMLNIPLRCDVTTDSIPVQTLMLFLYIGPHHITGNGVGFKPDILDMDVMDKVLEVSRDYYFLLLRYLA